MRQRKLQIQQYSDSHGGGASYSCRYPKAKLRWIRGEIEAEVDISQEIQETWSVGASVAVTAGPLSISVDPSYSIETKQIFMEKVKYKVRPGEKARCVAIVNYTITNGDLWKAGSQVGLVTSNVPATINGHDFEYVACDRKFITEQIPIQEPDSCNSATFRMLLGFAVWMPLCSFVTLFLFL
ncbi:hypothetical protein BKA62DRAFT_1354 [Auriculariales sp. MPI-PUGE-AT-0066]|nr:hypothetical protein BKA62DRAFT_1354 [Auriculariales sp. MPI-PUGE-AT-0066]